MPTKPKLLFIFITTFLLTNSLFAQKAEKTIAFNQKDLMAYKTDHHVYNFWLPGVKSWSKSPSMSPIKVAPPHSPAQSTRVVP